MLIIHYIQAVILVARTLAQTCSVTSETDRRLYTKPDTRLSGSTISHLLDFQLLQCVLECLLVKKCKSINYREYLGICELVSVNLDEVIITRLEKENKFVYYDIRGWPAEMAGACASRPCGGNQRCVPSTVYICVDIDCGPPPTLLEDNPMLYSRILPRPTATTTVGSRAKYDCAAPWTQLISESTYRIPSYPDRWKLCNSDFSWTGCSLRCNSRVIHCKAVKQCNPTFGDGHYWIFPHGSGKMKVYCHDMDSTPKTYLALPYHGNYAEQGARTEFSKVRLNIDKSGRIGINGSDFTFATVDETGVRIPFGQAGICGTSGAAMGRIGQFSVNLTGTGVRILQSSWAVPDGLTFRRAGPGPILVEGYCSWPCDHCAPSKQIYIYPVTYKDFDTADTVNPVCTTDHRDF